MRATLFDLGMSQRLTKSRLFQALRRSIKGDKEKPQISIAPKSAVAIVPPKKVGPKPLFLRACACAHVSAAVCLGGRLPR